MTNLITRNRNWDPFQAMEALHGQLDGWVRGFRRPGTSATDSEGKSVEWMPLVDIKEDDKAYHFTVELPAVKKEDISVTLEGGVLSIQGERKFEKEENGSRHHRIERSYGTFLRSFTVPEDAEEGDVKAVYKDGVLNVVLAKSEKAKPKLVDVKVN